MGGVEAAVAAECAFAQARLRRAKPEGEREQRAWLHEVEFAARHERFVQAYGAANPAREAH